MPATRGYGGVVGLTEGVVMAAEITASRTADGVFTVVARGELDAVTAPDLAAALQRALATERALIIDVREADLLAVAGARVLIAAAHACAARGGRCYVLAGPDHVARRVLDCLDPRPPLRLVADPDDIMRGQRA
ncbi:STAS domain-containing protein [Catenuloplanes atrovinosus]|uniref:Anti-anti-sigma factor n=1 Tax=Catenuloplanes atrovinosus TaxID=137266 RepID=A0AAE3YST4_9ACTN|nr:STAS domain-containing protein [Catenuloplanes atrovinosus]MDR7279244.1 anti-anti-sigma factor [Catenuloplanes atrovinosus]